MSAGALAGTPRPPSPPSHKNSAKALGGEKNLPPSPPTKKTLLVMADEIICLSPTDFCGYFLSKEIIHFEGVFLNHLRVRNICLEKIQRNVVKKDFASWKSKST